MRWRPRRRCLRRASQPWRGEWQDDAVVLRSTNGCKRLCKTSPRQTPPLQSHAVGGGLPRAPPSPRECERVRLHQRRGHRLQHGLAGTHGRAGTLGRHDRDSGLHCHRQASSTRPGTAVEPKHPASRPHLPMAPSHAGGSSRAAAPPPPSPPRSWRPCARRPGRSFGASPSALASPPPTSSPSSPSASTPRVGASSAPWVPWRAPGTASRARPPSSDCTCPWPPRGRCAWLPPLPTQRQAA